MHSENLEAPWLFKYQVGSDIFTVVMAWLMYSLVCWCKEPVWLRELLSGNRGQGVFGHFVHGAKCPMRVESWLFPADHYWSILHLGDWCLPKWGIKAVKHLKRASKKCITNVFPYKMLKFLAETFKDYSATRKPVQLMISLPPMVPKLPQPSVGICSTSCALTSAVCVCQSFNMILLVSRSVTVMC